MNNPKEQILRWATTKFEALGNASTQRADGYRQALKELEEFVETVHFLPVADWGNGIMRVQLKADNTLTLMNQISEFWGAFPKSQKIVVLDAQHGYDPTQKKAYYFAAFQTE